AKLSAERSAGTVFSLRSRRTINRRIAYLFGIEPLTSIFLLLFALSVYKIIASNSHFPYNSRKYELRISSDFWQIQGF
ncbi:MAG: hypothetical protein ACE144_18050, partial [Thermodesulfobacteriota bacterium]